MADELLHIKDSYYFDVPKFLARSNRTTRDDFPDWWVRLDGDYQAWEAGKLYDALAAIPAPKLKDKDGKPIELAPLPAKEKLLEQYDAWKEAEHSHHGVPFDRYLQLDKSQKWFQQRMESHEWAAAWQKATHEAAQFSQYQGQWDQHKISEYNKQLHGKVLIPQWFGRPKNLYEPAEGFVVSKFMIIELVVASLLAVVFIRLAAKIRDGSRPSGRLANLFEMFLVFMRDDVARPAIGKHDADRFLPLLWTIFFFVLGCNLFGMLPWAGSPTSSFGVTLSLAFVTLGTVFVSGMVKFGPVGFWMNLVPQMDMPWYLKIPIWLLLFPIELGGLMIKHGVLAVRLLANMVAGHLVLLGVLGLALAAAELKFGPWFMVATISVVASALFSLLELFVAFLQAYVFAFLSALFIGASVHHH